MSKIPDIGSGIAFLAIWLGLGVFIGMWHWRSKGDWAKDRYLRMYMALKFCFWITITWSVAAYWLDPSDEVRSWARIILFVPLAVVVWRQVYLLDEITRRRKRPKAKHVKKVADGS